MRANQESSLLIGHASSVWFTWKKITTDESWCVATIFYCLARCRSTESYAYCQTIIDGKKSCPTIFRPDFSSLAVRVIFATRTDIKWNHFSVKEFSKFYTSNARRYDSLDPRLNILESLFSTRFIHASPSIRINRTIIENSLGPRCVCSPLYELQSFTTTPSSSSRTRLKFSNIG